MYTYGSSFQLSSCSVHTLIYYIYIVFFLLRILNKRILVFKPSLSFFFSQRFFFPIYLMVNWNFLVKENREQM